VFKHEAGLGRGPRPGHVGPWRNGRARLGRSDGEKENNNLDLLEEMKVASLIQKLVGLRAAAGNAWDVLAMATIEGARCLGLERLTGSIEPGKAADLVAVDLRGLHTTPVVA
jgi:5-methylthioadenosine/S-adenosylhomocysteine deaminase